MVCVLSQRGPVRLDRGRLGGRSCGCTGGCGTVSLAYAGDCRGIYVMAAWISLIATALGALIAFSGSTLSEGIRSRREQARSQLETQRKMTVDFILAVDNVHSLLRKVATQSMDISQLPTAAREAVGSSGIYGTREQMLTSVPPKIAYAAETAFHALLAIRDVVSSGSTLDSSPYDQAYDDWAGAIWTLRQTAREAFGVAPLDLDKIHRMEADRIEKRNSRYKSS